MSVYVPLLRDCPRPSTVRELAECVILNLTREHERELERLCRCGHAWGFHACGSPHACLVDGCLDCRSYTAAEPLADLVDDLGGEGD